MQKAIQNTCSLNCFYLYNYLLIEDKEELEKLLSDFNNDAAKICCAYIINSPNVLYQNDYSASKLIYVKNGSLCMGLKNNGDSTHDDSNENVTLTQGNILFANAHTSVNILEQSQDICYFTIVIKKNFFDRQVMQALLEQPNLYDFFNYCRKVDTLNFSAHLVYKANHFTITQIFFILLNSLHENDLNTFKVTLLFLYNYLSVATFGKLFLSHSTMIHDPLMNLIMQYISNSSYDITLKNVAEHFNYNTTYISTLIKAKTGLSFKTHIKIFRLKRAATLLAHTDKTVLDISQLCGFNNLSLFNKQFKSFFSLTPGEYRHKYVEHK
jgi:AraC-like DNA-binding protein